MKSRLINLNTHSYYTFLESILSLDDIINFSIANNLEYASLIDKNIMYGAYSFYKKCIQNNIKPIIGIQFKYKKYDLIAIAKNYDGYQMITKLSSLIMTDNKILLEHFINDNIFVISLNNDFINDSKNLYFINKNDYNIPTIACQTAIYLNNNEFDLIMILNAIKNDEKIQISNLKQTNNTNYLLTPNEIKKKFNNDQVKNLNELVSQINLVFPEYKKINQIIDYQNELNISSNEYLIKLANEKLDLYLQKNHELDKNKYYERLNYELSIINKYNFHNYFLIVYDFVNYAKTNDIIIGPGRGSSAGSLVAFILNIVEIDPIKYNLIFERFLNINRLTMPDIDIDVMDEKRDKLIDYIFNKYGYDHVGHIATFSHIKAKQAIRDIGRVLNEKSEIIDKICKLITKFDDDIDYAIQQSDILKKEYLENKYLFEYAKKIINFPRQVSVHAAGIIISKRKITDIVPIQNCLNNKTMLQFNMDDLSEIGLIKFDILGLKNLTIINKILLLIKKIYDKKINLQTINLHDPKVYKLFEDKKTNGIFQFESSGMKNILSKIKPKEIEDLSISSAIYRPGAYKNIDLYINNKNSNIISNKVNSKINKILASTNGVIIYQEQIIQLTQLIANFDANKADQFRVAISKKKESEILNIKQDFINSAINNNFSLEEANKYFDTMLQFANYGFNHSHSLAYSFISYWLAYFKYYYPLITYSVLLTYNDLNQEKLIDLIKEAKTFNIQICLPNINFSTNSFTLFENKIFFSFTAINSLGYETTKKIIELRNNESNQKFSDPYKTIAKLSAIGISKTNIIKLIKVGAFDDLLNNREILLANVDTLTDKKKNIIDKNNNFIFDLNLVNVEDDKSKYAEYEKEILGICFSQTKLNKLFEKYKNQYNLKNINDSFDANVYTLIELVDWKEKKSKNDSQYLLMKIIEDSLYYDVSVFNTNEINIVKTNPKYLIVQLKKSNNKNSNFVLQKIIAKVDYD